MIKAPDRGRSYVMFGDRKFALTVDSPDLELVLEQNDGSIIEWKDRFQREITPQLIIVSDSIDFESYDQLNTMMVPIVTPQWVHDSVSQRKQLPTRPYSPDPRHFMRQVTICLVDLSPGDTEGFKAGIQAAGGQYNAILTTHTTHVIATNLNSEIVATARDEEYDIAVVSPEWFDDCMKLGRKVDEGPYYLAPEDNKNPSDDTNSPGLLGTFAYESTDTTVPQKAIERSVSHALGSTVFSNRKFYLGNDLDISEKMKKHIIYLIEANGGELASSLETANTYLGKWRQGEEYIYASKRKYVVGNLLWLYWMAIQQRWDLPTKYLLHYPEVPGGLSDMKDKVICITNYTGEARNYLRTLITSIGATYTGTMCGTTNTHLIAAYGQGPKYDAAKNWGIQIVNHLWLEDSYSKWLVQDANIPRYQYLPQNLDLTTLIGSTTLSLHVLKQFYTNTEVVERHLPSRAARDKAQKGVHNSVLKEHLFRKQMLEGTSVYERSEKTKKEVKIKEPESSSKSKAAKSKAEQAAAAAGDDKEEGEEARTPDTASPASPSAAPLPDNSPSKKQGSPAAPSAAAPPKSSSRPAASKAQAPPAKRQKLETIKVLMTSVDNIRNKQKLPKLGIKIVESGKADVLVAPKLLKTQKFLCGLAWVDNIVSPAWLEACIRANKVVDQDEFQLGGVAKLLEKSKALRDQKIRLFSGKKFLISGDVRGGPRITEEIVKAHGGKIVRRDGAEVIYVKGDNEESESSVTLDSLIQTIVAMKPLV